MTDKQVRIMDAIQEKETELKVKVIEAKKKAETKVASARKETAKIREEAHLRAEQEVKTLVSEGLAQANIQEKEILASNKSSVSSLKKLSKKNFAAAIDIVMRAVTSQDFIESRKPEQE
ncbi:hypothetical protein LCGC14_2929760, partial [marine sediment metagenome]